MEYDNTNRGAVFRNEKKKSDKHPDYDGSLNVGGVEYWINGWLKTGKSGKPFISLSVKLKEAKADAAPDAHNQAKADGYAPQPAALDDEIPF